MGRLISAFAFCVVSLAGCGTGGDPEPVLNESAPATFSGPEATTTSAPAATAPVSTTSDAEAFNITEDLVYHSGDDRFVGAEALIDVVAPAAEGSWPVVVAFHGDPRSMGKSSMRSMATQIAEQGRVVFVADWGHTDRQWEAENSLQTAFDTIVQEIRCAVAFAEGNAAEYGGDPGHLTVFGYSAGGNAALMAGFADSKPLEACVVSGPGVTPQAVVSGDGDVLLGAGTWDVRLAEEPEAFYALTPWRLVDRTDDFPVYITAAENSYGPYDRSIGEDAHASFIVDRHVDIDLVGELDALGLLADGGFSLRDSNEWAYQALVDAGYDAELILLADSTHDSLSGEGLALLVDTVVGAERLG